MDVLYRSKGISKAAVIKKLISIVICLALALTFVIIGNSKVKGPMEAISIGGGPIQYVSTERSRFSEQEQRVIAALAIVSGVVAAIDVGLLTASRISWTEIDSRTIHANCMGKTVSYPIAGITEITKLGDYLMISGSAGKATLITDDPKKVHELLNQLVRQQKG